MIEAEELRSSAIGTVTAKGDRDMVTEVDLAVERTVREYLAEVTPEIGFLGEEEGETSGAGAGRYWALDPIDGTANFAHGLPLFAISLGLVDGQTSVLGVIDVPLMAERYCGYDGGGATLNGAPLRRSGAADLASAIISIGDYAVGVGAESRNRARFELTALLAGQAQRIRMVGSAAIDLAWVAAGRLDGSIMLSNKPWDTAAGIVVAREAGAFVCDLNGSPHSLTSSETISGSMLIRDHLLAIVRQAHRSWPTLD